MHYHCEVLHMHRANASARRFYEHMGFADRPRARDPSPESGTTSGGDVLVYVMRTRR